MKFFQNASFTCICGVLLLGSCTSKLDPANDPRFAGNREMAALLDSLNRTADPDLNYYLGSAKAEKMKHRQPANMTPYEKLKWNVMYYNQLLNAGRTEEAAQGFNFLLNDQTNGYAKFIKDSNMHNVKELLGVTYLRMGEQQNCILNHTSASCILPLKAEGIHKNRTGSEKAIETYTQILEKNPNDLQSRWLMNVAYMTLGNYPDSVPTKYLVKIPEYDASKSGLKPFEDRAIDAGVDVNGLAGGSCIEDFNNDGLMDIFCTSYGLFDNVHLFIHQADGSFKDMTEAAQLKGILGGLNTVQADFNNDGFIDILVLRGAWLDKGGEFPNSLLRNNGDGTFSDITKAAGMLSFCPTEIATWGDFNNDGWLDVFVANENNPANNYPCELWLNNKNETFTNVAKQVGLDGNFGYAKGAKWADFNNDGMLDMFISILGANNRLFMNRGGKSIADWKFEDVSKKAGVEAPFYSFPALVFDYDNDGFQDIYVAGFHLQRLDKVGEDYCREYLGMPSLTELPRMFHNNGNETFTDVTSSLKLNKVTYAMGSNFGDIDNDGWMDIYCGTGAFDYTSLVPNRMFRNVDGKYFEEVSSLGVAHLQKGHGLAFGDLDNDGDQDIYVTMGGAFEGDVARNVLFENNNDSRSWLTVEVQGKTIARSALETKIRVNVKDSEGKNRSIYSTVNSGGTFGASSLQQEIGLGYIESIESVEVIWSKPGTPITKYSNVKPNTFVRLVEGNPKAEVLNRKLVKFAKGAPTEHSGHH